jgi:2-hydroxy-4-carboxymuconate semialdehyde hemiacetal dehydrogenase
MQIGLIGHGAVARIHVDRLRRLGMGVQVVYGPDAECAKSFADAHGVPDVAADLEGVAARCGVAIVASPSDFHFEQARKLLSAGCHCLVELPACSSAAEACELMDSAREAKVLVGCAHTARYLPAMVRLGRLLKEGSLGEICQVVSVRAIPPRNRTWIDDALLHHAAHPIDLLLEWFGGLEPVACVAYPQVERAQDLTVSGRLPNDAPVSLSVSYTSRIAQSQLTIVGSLHTVTTDGFGFIESDNENFAWSGDGEEGYEGAIEAQDAAFVCACRGRGSAVAWPDTIRLAECLDRFRALGQRRLSKSDFYV